MEMLTPKHGKISKRDETLLRVFRWVPWLGFFILTLPAPILFLLLFITATATDTAAVYLILALLTLGLGALVSLLLVILVFFFRRRWLKNLRDRLAADGITASEVIWFTAELTSAERQALAELRTQNPVLADAYQETLASRLTASRIRQRAGKELLRIERRINRARSLSGVDTGTLISDLQADHDRFVELRNEASGRLTEARARLQTIEAAASRSLNQKETDLMLRRLNSAQDQLPLVLEMAKLEHQALTESQLALGESDPESRD